MNEKTILYVIGSLDLGGAERHIAAIAPRLKKHGWQPMTYCLTGRGSLAGEVEQAGVKVVAPRWEIETGQSRIGKFARLMLSGFKLFGFLLSTRPRIVHFFLPAAYLIGAPIAIAAGASTRVMSRRSLNLYQIKHPVLRRIEPMLHRRMRVLLGNSQAVVAELRAEAAGAVPVDLIYNGVDLAGVPMRSARPVGGTLTLIIVANLIAYKGHSDLFHALASVAEKLPSSWELLCVGRDDGLGPSLRELARDLRIESHIKLLGSRRDIPDLLAAADIGILCSHEEGFSNAVLEGMAAGLPMVVTAVGGNAEAVVDGESGLVVPARNPEALGEAILRLASDGELRKQMGAAARRRAEEQFSMERCVQRYDEVYRGLIRNHEAPTT